MGRSTDTGARERLRQEAREKIARARAEGGALREAIVRGHGCCLVYDPEFDQSLWDEALALAGSPDAKFDALKPLYDDLAKWILDNGGRAGIFKVDEHRQRYVDAFKALRAAERSRPNVGMREGEAKGDSASREQR